MIRLARESDVDRIVRIYEAIHDEEEKGRMRIGWVRGVYPVRETAEAALQRGDLFVEEDGGMIVASAIINQIQVPEYADCPWEYTVSDEKVMVLHTLTVDPGIKGKGYGKQFVRFYEQFALEHGCNYLRMDTQEKNTDARAFYKKQGYREPAIVDCIFNGIPNVKLVCLEKRI